MIGWLTCEAVPVLSEHHGDSADGHEVAHTVHARPLEARSALAGVRNLLEDLVPFSASVISQSFYLLGEGVAAAGLLIGRDAGIEDGTARAVAIRGRHGYSFTSSEARTPSTSAIFFSVSGWAPPRCSTTATAPAERPAFRDSWR